VVLNELVSNPFWTMIGSMNDRFSCSFAIIHILSVSDRKLVVNMLYCDGKGKRDRYFFKQTDLFGFFLIFQNDNINGR
jgi:hypothetical protein